MGLSSPAGLGVICFFLAVTTTAVIFIIKIWKDFDDTEGGHK